jgi:hypothetical protein
MPVVRAINAKAAIIVGFTLINTPSLLHAEDAFGVSNCVDGTCFGATRIYVDGVSFETATAISDVFCRLTGIDVSAIEEVALSQEEYFYQSGNTVLFLSSLAAAEELNADLVPPPDLPTDAVSFSGAYSGSKDGAQFIANYLVVDATRLGCNTIRCVFTQTVNYLSQVYEWEVIVDQTQYGDGSQCN